MNDFEKTSEYRAALAIVRRLRGAGFKAYFVGGAVRDALLGRPPKDIDIATSATPEQAAELFPHHHAVGAAFGVLVAVEDGIPFEVATLREEREYMDGRHPEIITYTDDPKLDAARRDFTINAMFYDPVNGEVIDYFGGRRDLERGVLRCVGDPEQRFNEDYLRMLRAVRFGVRFGLRIDPPAAAAIRRLKENAARLSGERVRQELTLMLTGPRPADAVRMLSEFGLLGVLLPEVEVMRGVEQPPEYHPEGDVFEHTMLMLEHMALPGVELAWSVLLHDVGKPAARTVGEDGVSHFYGHETAGAETAERVLKRLHFSNAQIETVTGAVASHMRFASVHLMKRARLRRLMAEPNFTMELELHRLDCLSSNRLMGNFVFLLDEMSAQAGQVELPPPLLNGRDLIALGLKPGVEFGRILKEIEDLRLEGRISSREEALAAVLQTVKPQ